MAGEVGGHRPRPGLTAVARDRPRQRLVRPGRRGHPDPAGDGVRGDGERRDARPAARRQGDRRHGRRGRAARPGRSSRALSTTLIKLMQHVVTEVPFYREPDARPRLRRRRQDRHRPDLGSGRERRPRRLEAQPLQLLVRRLHRPRDGRPRPRRRHPHRGGQAHRRQGRPARDAGHVVRALPADRDRRDHDARPAGRPSDRAGRRHTDR